MNLTTIQRAELFLSEIYCRAINEFPSLQNTDLNFKAYSAKNLNLLVDNIGKYKNLSDKQIKLCKLLDRGIQIVSDINNRVDTLSEADLVEFVDDYLLVDTNYSQSINFELLKRPFDLKNKQYKKYLKLKKEKLFLELINTTYTEQPYGWKSISNVVEVTYNRYMAEFKKFDVAWLESEISNKENYLPKIEGLFTKKKAGWEHVYSSDHPTDIVIKYKVDKIPDLVIIKSETIKTQEEIVLLGQLLDSLKLPLPNQDFIKKHLPYYGEGTERLLRELLRNNKELVNKIINK